MTETETKVTTAIDEVFFFALHIVYESTKDSVVTCNEVIHDTFR